MENKAEEKLEESFEEENEINEEEEEEETFVSNLGNKDYWDKTYSQEINQFDNNNEEIGYLWYGKQVQNRTVQYIKEKFTNKDTKILDIGCGNGSLLYELIKQGFNNLEGMDYSEKSIELAEKIKQLKIDKGDKIYEKIQFYTEDINKPNILEKKENIYYDLIHDKGTLDAYMLNKENSFIKYSNYLNLKMKDRSFLIISSVNHLKNDLLDFFVNNFSENYKFELIEEIAHKSFNFGGSVGQAVTTLIFKIFK